MVAETLRARRPAAEPATRVNLLAISTSTDVQGVWLQTSAGGAGAEHRVGRGQPRNLTRVIWDLLAAAGLGVADLALVASDVGPGSFTGLRLGLATVRALAWAGQLPVIGVGSLEILVAEARAAGVVGPIAVALPARAGVSYVGLATAGGELDESLVPDDAAAAFWQARSASIAAGVALIGSPLRADGPLAAALQQAGMGATWPDLPAWPTARRLATIAAAAPVTARAGATTLGPRYLAASEAEVHGGVVVEQVALRADRL